MGDFKRNLIGALTSKPFAFTARSWEVVMVPSIDIYDSFLGSLRLDFRNNDLLRVLPLINEELNEEWLTDKARFGYDGLKRQRLLKPYVSVFGRYPASQRHTETYFKALVGLNNTNFLFPVSQELFASAFSSVLRCLKPKQLVVFFGKEVDLESAISARLTLENQFKRVVYKSGDYSNFSCVKPDLLKFTIDSHAFLSARSLLLVGSNLRWELPLFNIKVMRRVRSDSMVVFAVAVRSVFNFSVVNLSSNAHSFVRKLAAGRSRLLLRASKLFVILSYNLAEYASVISLNPQVKVGIVFPWASTVTAMEVCPTQLNKEVSGENSVALSMGSDSLTLPSNGVAVGLLSHGHNAHSKLDFVFPCAAYSESNSHFFNLFRAERYARFGYALSKDIMPFWASVLKLFQPGPGSLLPVSSFRKLTVSSLVSKPFENEQSDQLAAAYLYNLPTFVSVANPITPFYEVVPSYYRTHYSSRSSKPISLASSRFSSGLSNFINR